MPKGSRRLRQKQLIDALERRAKSQKSGEYSLLLPEQFLDYLRNCYFKDFDLSSSDVELSRHSVSHGAAKPDSYTRSRALQGILVLDQLFYFL